MAWLSESEMQETLNGEVSMTDNPPPLFRFGEPRIFIPVSHPDRIGGPVGYVERKPGEEGNCPIEPRIEEES